MGGIKLRHTAAAVVLALLGAAAAFGVTVSSESAAAAGNAGVVAPDGEKVIAGTVDTRMVIKRFTAVGRRIVGRGVAISTLRNADGVVTSTTQKSFGITLRTSRGRLLQQTGETCQILFLELEELDLTLLGLRAFLRGAVPGEPIRLKLSAVRENGVLGRLFCDLAQTTLATAAKARAGASALNKRLSGAKVMRAKATLYAPNQVSSGVSSSAMADVPPGLCEVLHLVLGPLHLDILGLVADLNKIVLDLWAIPGTTLGDLFCSITGGPPTTTAATTGP
jgi:hypothetical protein